MYIAFLFFSSHLEFRDLPSSEAHRKKGKRLDTRWVAIESRRSWKVTRFPAAALKFIALARDVKSLVRRSGE